ncbi:MAG: DUF2683 family protein [Chitinophagales bacterium]|jgi:aspartyl aminopeptidase|nr:hypothetical protein [Sphingobacteriales bacterium]
MDAIIIPAEKKNKEKLIEFLKSLKISFETITNVEDSIYSKEFQKLLDQSLKQADEGEVRKVHLDEIWK